MKVKFVKELPPETRGRKGFFGKLVTQLDHRPGVWALLRKYKMAKTANSTATSLRRNYPGYEFSSRGSEIYGRKKKGHTR